MKNESVPPPLAVGIAYNLKKGIASDVQDMEAEYDSFDTISAIRGTLAASGMRVELLEADKDFVESVKKANVDVVFNIAEGTKGRGREAQVPAILDFLGIPYTGSDETTLGMALDKSLTKRYLSAFGIKTPAYQLVESPDFMLDSSLRFPLIVKPNSEGSSKGISDMAIVDGPEQLQKLIEKDFRDYDQPMLLEEYIRGREFTVGILGNGDDRIVFEPMEICYLTTERAHTVYSYTVKREYKKYIEYQCPPKLDGGIVKEMKDTAARIYEALECRDFSRIDFRLSEDGTPYFIEINPLPGLAPGYSDYPMLAQFCGMDYQTLVAGVLNSALKRRNRNAAVLNRGELK